MPLKDVTDSTLNRSGSGASFTAPPPPEKPQLPPHFEYVLDNVFLCERFSFFYLNSKIFDPHLLPSCYHGILYYNDVLMWIGIMKSLENVVDVTSQEEVEGAERSEANGV